MRRQRFLLAALLAAFIVTIPAISPRHRATAQHTLEAAAAQKSSSTSYQENVTTTVLDANATGGQLLMRSDDYNGVGQATYTTFSGKAANSPSVDSEITTDGKWLLSMNDQSGRTLWITPNQAIDSSQPPAPPAGYYVVPRVYGICRDQNGNIVPYENLVNGSGNCELGVNFNFAGTLYKLHMSPISPSGSGGPPSTCPSGGCPSTGVVTVTCNAVSNGQCVNWTIEPNISAPNASVANLYRYYSPTPKSASWIFIGQYYNSFRIGLTNP